jgi:hypothetical protein
MKISFSGVGCICHWLCIPWLLFKPGLEYDRGNVRISQPRYGIRPVSFPSLAQSVLCILLTVFAARCLSTLRGLFTFVYTVVYIQPAASCRSNPNTLPILRFPLFSRMLLGLCDGFMSGRFRKVIHTTSPTFQGAWRIKVPFREFRGADDPLADTGHPWRCLHKTHPSYFVCKGNEWMGRVESASRHRFTANPTEGPNHSSSTLREPGSFLVVQRPGLHAQASV